MDLDTLISDLSKPTAFPYPVDNILVRQTHISVVFLAGRHVYKVKKPVALGFLDFSTLEKRLHFCKDEVRLNRRLAAHVYEGVVPITRSSAGLVIEGSGEAVEWAVKMQRLPEEATLERRLSSFPSGEQGNPGAESLVEGLARRIASFHAEAEASAHIASFGRFEVIARNTRENFGQSSSRVGTLSAEVFSRLQTLSEDALADLRGLMDSRAERGLPRDTHGDLHLDHVYLFPDRSPPDDLVIIDCIEFNDRFRFADPVADMAFLVMDFSFHGRRDLARAFADAYFRAAGDEEEGRRLLPFYTAYRAAVRAKVEGLELSEKEVPEAERSAALGRARAHWLLALGELEAPARKPCLVLIAGLPGTGKSTLARTLAEEANFSIIRSDVVRKELAGIAATQNATAAFGEDVYSADWTDRTYAECLRRAEQQLFAGQRVIVDANFPDEPKRQAFLNAAGRLAVPALLLHCHADPKTIRARLQGRHGDASDADWRIYLRAAERWERPGEATCPFLRRIDTEGEPHESLARAREVLGQAGLASAFWPGIEIQPRIPTDEDG